MPPVVRSEMCPVIPLDSMVSMVFPMSHCWDTSTDPKVPPGIPLGIPVVIRSEIPTVCLQKQKISPKMPGNHADILLVIPPGISPRILSGIQFF